ALETMADRPVDGLIVAELEVEKRRRLERPPLASVERLAADEVERARDPVAAAPRQDENHLVRHPLADQGEEGAVQVWPAPFPRAGVNIEGEEGAQVLRADPGAGQSDDLDPRLRLAPLAPDGLAPGGGEGGEVVVEGRPAPVLPPELQVLAAQQS